MLYMILAIVLFFVVVACLWHHIIYYVLTRLGGVYIKLGQWISTRTDFFPNKLCTILSLLRDQVPPEPFPKTLRTISPILHLDSIEPVPIGTGCIAQVHPATFKGEDVVVKVLRTGIERKITNQFHFMKYLVYFGDKIPFLSHFRFGECLHEFQQVVLLQTNFVAEAATLIQFGELFAREEFVRFPTVKYADEVAIIQSFERGEKLQVILFAKEQGSHAWAYTNIAESLTKIVVLMIKRNMMHGDLHPGNILYDRDTKQIVLLDVGMTIELDKVDYDNFVDLVVAVANGEGQRAGELMIERSDRPPIAKKDDYIAEMTKIIDGTDQASAENLGHALRKVLVLVSTYQVPISPAFTSLLISLVLIEGIIRQLDPDINILQIVVKLLL